MDEHFCKAMAEANPETEDLGYPILIQREYSVDGTQADWYLLEVEGPNNYSTEICKITHCPWCGTRLKYKKRRKWLKTRGTKNED